MSSLTPEQRAKLRRTLYEIRWHSKQLEYYNKVKTDRKFDSIIGKYKEEGENKNGRS